MCSSVFFSVFRVYGGSYRELGQIETVLPAQVQYSALRGIERRSASAEM